MRNPVTARAVRFRPELTLDFSPYRGSTQPSTSQVLLELSFARVLPAFESAAFDGTEDLPPMPIPVTSSQMQFYWNSSV